MKKILKNKIRKIKHLISYIPYHIYKPSLPKNENKSEVIISLTSYPARIWCLPMVIGSIVRQSKLPDRIVLYLSKEQFTDLKHPILRSLMKQGVRIVLVEGDLRSHKKYYYAMQEYPDSIIITIDDDVIYDKYMIDDLYQSYLRHPKAISAKRVHGMKFDEKKRILSYNQWEYEKNDCIDIESLQLMATGCGGILYPPHCLHESWMDEKGILETCLYGDDLWLKVKELQNNTPVVLAKSDHYKIRNVWGTLTDGLASENVLLNRNDEQLRKICQYLKINLYQLIMNKE